LARRVAGPELKLRATYAANASLNVDSLFDLAL
jgi:hypothetical protein